MGVVEFSFGENEEFFIVFEDDVLSEVYIMSEHFKNETHEISPSILTDETIDKIHDKFNELDSQTSEYIAELNEYKQEVSDEYDRDKI